MIAGSGLLWIEPVKAYKDILDAGHSAIELYVCLLNAVVRRLVSGKQGTTDRIERHIGLIAFMSGVEGRQCEARLCPERGYDGFRRPIADGVLELGVPRLLADVRSEVGRWQTCVIEDLRHVTLRLFNEVTLWLVLTVGSKRE